MELKFFGRACFTLKTPTCTMAFDPFLTGNSFNIAKPEDIHPDYVFVTHGHGDHLGDSLKLAKQNPNALFIVTAEMAGYLREKGVNNIEMGHIGGTIKLPFGKVRFTPAIHGAGIPGGLACGFIVSIGEVHIYFAGDTALFSDMKLLGELVRLDYALLPIGDRFTMGPEDAAIAASYLGAKNIIPMHYNGDPGIMQDPLYFQSLVAERAAGNVIIMQPGETIEIEDVW